MSVINVRTKAHEQVVDVTEDVEALAASMNNGVCSLFVQHTTCALTILTNEEGVAEDLLSVLHGLVPQTTAYVHDSADHVRAHVLSALVGWQVGSPDEAVAAVDAGCDLVIAQGIEAGGLLRGNIGLSVLLSQILERVDPPVVAARKNPTKPWGRRPYHRSDCWEVTKQGTVPAPPSPWQAESQRILSENHNLRKWHTISLRLGAMTRTVQNPRRTQSLAHGHLVQERHAKAGHALPVVPAPSIERAI